jgi:uncharacterized membrane protein YidH (DUF202 family)
MKDAGLQPERTALAWRRTALSMLVNGALLVRGSVKSDSTVLFLVSMALVVASLSTFGIATWRHRTLLRQGVPEAPHATVMLLVTAVVVLSTVAGIAGVTGAS